MSELVCDCFLQYFTYEFKNKVVKCMRNRVSLDCNFYCLWKFDLIVSGDMCKCVIVTCNQYMLKGAKAHNCTCEHVCKVLLSRICFERGVNCSILLGQIFLYENQIDEICDNWEYLGLHYSQMLGNYWVYVIKVFCLKST